VEELSASVLLALKKRTGRSWKVEVKTTVEDSGMDTYNLWGRVATV